MAVIVANNGTTTLTYNNASIGEVTSLSFDGFSVSAVESTTISATTKTFLPGVISPGTITCEVNSKGGDSGNDAGQEAVRTALSARTVNAFVLTFSDGTIASGTAIVTGYSIKAATDAIITASISFQCAGAITIN